MATTPLLQRGNGGSTPSGMTGRGKVAGYGLPGRTANAVFLREMGVRIPCLPLVSEI